MKDKKLARKKMLHAYTKQDILKAAIDIIASKGVQNLTMDRVATEAGVAKGTLYIHFKNKKQIFEAAIKESIVPLIEEQSSIMESDLPPDKKLEKVSRSHLEFFNKHKKLYRALLYSRNSAHDGRNRYNSSEYRGIIKKTSAVVEEGIALGLFQPADPTKVAAMFIEVIIAVAIQRLFSDVPTPIADDVRLITGFTMHGISK
jgi:TetR/AcrR family transcriptional regulator